MKPWVFKCYTRDQETRVCLLEEQTDQLSRGSTGLISWQGATCLLDWAEWSQTLHNKTVLEIGELSFEI